MNNILNETIIELMKVQEKKMEQLRTEMADIKATTQELKPLNDHLTKLDFRLIHLNKKLDEARFPIEETQALSSMLTQGITAWQQPKKVRHHHHASNLLLVTAGLFLALVLVAASWWLTTDKLDAYKVNDIKYRLLQFDGSPVVQEQLKAIDSLFRQDNGKFRDSVTALEVEQERQIRLKLEIEKARNKLNNLEKEIGPNRK